MAKKAVERRYHRRAWQTYGDLARPPFGLEDLPDHIDAWTVDDVVGEHGCDVATAGRALDWQRRFITRHLVEWWREPAFDAELVELGWRAATQRL